jgi:hypothetical protein
MEREKCKVLESEDLIYAGMKITSNEKLGALFSGVK